MIRPSSLPALKQCPRFESGEAQSFTLDGTKRHEALESMFNDPCSELSAEWRKQLDDESIEGIEWAFDYIQVNAPMLDHELHIERKMEIMDDDFNPLMSGTLDYQCGNNLFDIKWRRRDYLPQMAAYALMMIQETGWHFVQVHILFMESQNVQKFGLNEAKCWKIINEARYQAEDLNAKPNPCDYCGWCKHTLTCEALNDRVKAVNEGREDWELEHYHAIQLADPEEIAKAIPIARAVKTWADAVDHFAKKFVFEGGTIPGYEVRKKQGSRKIPSIEDAFARCGMDQEKFMACCSASFSKLVEQHKITHSISKAVATKELERMLGDAVTREKPSYQITKTKN